MNALHSDTLESYMLLLALESTKIVVLCGLASRIQRRPEMCRAVWRSCALALVMLALLETSGIGRSIAAAIHGPTTSWSPAQWLISGSFGNDKAIGETRAGAFGEFVTRPTLMIVSIVWLLGSIITAIRLLYPRALMLPFLSRCQYVNDADLLNTIRELQNKIGILRPILLLESREGYGPFTIGATRPVVVLPSGFRSELTEAQQRSILAHELGHIRAWDAHWSLLNALLAIALWWHPLVWYTKARNFESSELGADRIASSLPEGGLTLAEGLLRVGRARFRPSIDPTLQNALGAQPSRLLKKRIRAALNADPTCPTEPNPIVTGLANFGLAAFLALSAILCIA